MTNIEKVKRILDAGHWVKVTYPDGVIRTITSYYEDGFSYIDSRGDTEWDSLLFADVIIEVIQRIPTPYVAGDKVLVLSNPCPNNQEIEDMVGEVCEILYYSGTYYKVLTNYSPDCHFFPAHCLAPAFDDDSLSGKEAKVTIDGKEYSVTLKLI